jgi:hypothetical protein
MHEPVCRAMNAAGKAAALVAVVRLDAARAFLSSLVQVARRKGLKLPHAASKINGEGRGSCSFLARGGARRPWGSEGVGEGGAGRGGSAGRGVLERVSTFRTEPVFSIPFVKLIIKGDPERWQTMVC